MLKANGYQLTSGYTSRFLGIGGPHIDRYMIHRVRRLKDTTLCTDNGEGIYQKMRAYGICNGAKKLGNLNDLNRWVRGKSLRRYKGWRELVLDELGVIHFEDKPEHPQFKFFYTWRPMGHTVKGYQNDNQQMREDYIAYFSKNASDLANTLDEVVTLLRERDPSGILLVFGDHGAYLSKETPVQGNETFYCEDRHLIEMAVFSSENACASRDALSYYSKDYFTPARVLAALVRCLASNPKQLEALLAFDEKAPVLDMLLKLPQAARQVKSVDIAPVAP